MFSFVDHVYDIWRVSEKQNVDVGVGYAMFLADVRNGTNTNTGLTDFDFAAAKIEFDKMDDATLTAELEKYHKFTNGKFGYYFEICEAYPDKAAVQKVIEAFKANPDKVAEE